MNSQKPKGPAATAASNGAGVVPAAVSKDRKPLKRSRPSDEKVTAPAPETASAAAPTKMHKPKPQSAPATQSHSNNHKLPKKAAPVVSAVADAPMDVDSKAPAGTAQKKRKAQDTAAPSKQTAAPAKAQDTAAPSKQTAAPAKAAAVVSTPATVPPPSKKAKKRAGDDVSAAAAGAAASEEQSAVNVNGKAHAAAKVPTDPLAARKARKLDSRDAGKYINKQRTLVFASRGISNRDRHLLGDLRDLLPHSKKEVKLDTKGKLAVVNEVAEMDNCNNCIFFEARKKQDLYMWMAKTPNGPSVKFEVQSVHTMAEVKLTGNCLKGARPVLSFDPAFDATPHHRLLKEMMVQVFGTPKGHPKAKPFVDHVFAFFIANERVWFRNYQIVYELDKSATSAKDPVLVEIGPRFVLNPIRIFAGSFGGATLWENASYVSPNRTRSDAKRAKSATYVKRVKAQQEREIRKEAAQAPEDQLGDVFE